MFKFLVILISLIALMLILIILLQAGKGGGLAASFGVASSSTDAAERLRKRLRRSYRARWRVQAMRKGPRVVRARARTARGTEAMPAARTSRAADPSAAEWRRSIGAERLLRR
jgi:protein translocase SecG subunit